MAQIITFEKAQPAHFSAIAQYTKSVKKRLAVISIDRGWPLRNVDDFVNRLYIVMLLDKFWTDRPLAYRLLVDEKLLISISQSFIDKMLSFTSTEEVPVR